MFELHSHSKFVLFEPSEIAKFQLLVQENETPLWEYWDEFVCKYLERNRSIVTVANVRDTLRFVIRNLKLVTIEQCNTPKVLDDALSLAKQERKFSNVTFNSYLKNLNTYFRWLENLEYILENKIRKVPKAKDEVNEQYTLSEQQIRLVIGHIYTRRQSRLERFRNTLFIHLLRYTGARPCELLSLQIKDFRKTADTYTLVLKGKKQKGRLRYYRVPSDIRDSFEGYLEFRNRFRPNEPNLFVSTSKRTGWTNKGMVSLFKKLSKELGFKVTAYAFRRFVATKLHTEGLALTDIMSYLGHSRPSTTYRYIERSAVLTMAGSEIMERGF